MTRPLTQRCHVKSGKIGLGKFQNNNSGDEWDKESNYK